MDEEKKVVIVCAPGFSPSLEVIQDCVDKMSKAAGEDFIVRNRHEHEADISCYAIEKEPTHESWKGKGSRRMRVK